MINKAGELKYSNNIRIIMSVTSSGATIYTVVDNAREYKDSKELY